MMPKFYSTPAEIERDVLEYDVVIVGAGPAGLSAAIRLKQLEQQMGREVNVVVLEKGSEAGAHILSGCCFDPKALDELFPDWRNEDSPVKQPVTKDKFLYLTEKMAIPTPLLPSLHADGCYVISLSLLTRWLAERATDMGVEIYAGFPAAEPLYDDKGAVRGVLTGDMGIGKDGQPKDSFTPGVEVVGKQTIFSEGCRGSCTKKLMSKFDLNKDAQEQTYALGVKELWSIDPSKAEPGLVLHTGGWPLGTDSFGGSFLYHAEGNKVHAGFVVGLDYQNPYLSIYEEFQRWKTHPAIAPTFEGGEVISYGARTITEGGLQCLPKLHMPGAMLAGDSAGTLIAARIKGAHTAMKMGMLSAEAIAQKADEIFEEGAEQMDLQNFDRKFKASWVHEELYKYRNFRPAVNNYGFYIGSAIAGFDQFIARGNLPFTLKFAHSGDHKSCKPAAQAQKIEYPKGDGKLTFDLLSNLILSGTNHEEDQPVHLHVKPETLKDMKRENFETFAGPEGRYCPARVYEWLENENGETYLQINASNCLHCKACSIKDYGQRIEWRVPEGGGGPQYTEM
jgi:electron-transferring-flavoprotein dehydrogenase